MQRLTGVQYPLCQTGKPRLVDGRKSQCFPDREALAAPDGSVILAVSDGQVSPVCFFFFFLVDEGLVGFFNVRSIGPDVAFESV